jgi:hypothetical protein
MTVLPTVMPPFELGGMAIHTMPAPSVLYGSRSANAGLKMKFAFFR